MLFGEPFNHYNYNKQADKGGSFVIQNHKDHLEESYRLLSDADTYRVLLKGPLPEFQLDLINEASKDELLNKKERLLLLSTTCSTPYFYHLHKVHKTLENPPGRQTHCGKYH